MRFILLSLIFTPLLSLSQVSSSADLIQKGYKKYETKSGRIDYTIGGIAKGEETLIFDSYGWESSKRRSMQFKLHKIPTSKNQQEIRDGEWVYRLNHKDSTLRKRVDKKWSNQPKPIDPKEVSEAVLFQLGGEYKADSLLLDRSCQVWVFQNKNIQEMWVWKGLLMKSISKLGDGLVITEANKVALDVAVSDTHFKVPNYFKEID